MSEPDTPEGLIWLLYIIITCICTFLLLGLFVAVVTGTFAQVMVSSKAQPLITCQEFRFASVATGSIARAGKVPKQINPRQRTPKRITTNFIS